MTVLDERAIRVEKKMKLTMVLISIALVPLAAVQPSCMSLYWLTSASLGLLQNLAFSVPSIRRALGKCFVHYLILFNPLIDLFLEK